MRIFKSFTSSLLLAIIIAAVFKPGSVVWADTNTPITVMTYNVRIDWTGESWARRSDAVYANLNRKTPDIIAFQEASEFMMEWYVTSLPGYAFRMGERSDGFKGGWHEYLPIFYRKDRIRFIQSGSFWVSETPFTPGAPLSGSKPHGRVFHWALLEDRLSGREFVVGNAHTHGEEAETPWRS